MERACVLPLRDEVVASQACRGADQHAQRERDSVGGHLLAPSWQIQLARSLHP